MGGYTTIPEALQAASTTVGSAADELAAADCAEPLDSVATALPGSPAGGAARSFANRWSAEWKKLVGEARKHGASLAEAARTYQDAEHQNQQVVRHAGGGH